MIHDLSTQKGRDAYVEAMKNMTPEKRSEIIQENNIKKKDEIESLLIDIFDRIGIEVPSNHEDITQFVFEDVCETADPVNWNDSDVAIGFRRWIEAQAKN